MTWSKIQFILSLKFYEINYMEWLDTRFLLSRPKLSARATHVGFLVDRCNLDIFFSCFSYQ